MQPSSAAAPRGHGLQCTGGSVTSPAHSPPLHQQWRAAQQLQRRRFWQQAKHHIPLRRGVSPPPAKTNSTISTPNNSCSPVRLGRQAKGAHGVCADVGGQTLMHATVACSKRASDSNSAEANACKTMTLDTKQRHTLQRAARCRTPTFFPRPLVTQSTAH